MYAWGFVVICALLILMPVVVNTLTGRETGTEPVEKRPSPSASKSRERMLAERERILANARRRRPSTSSDRVA